LKGVFLILVREYGIEIQGTTNESYAGTVVRKTNGQKVRFLDNQEAEEFDKLFP